MRPAAVLAAMIGPAALAGCAPMSLADAERVCLSDARAATGPEGMVGVGVGTGGRNGTHTFGRFELSVSSDYIMGRDPAEVYANCVQRRSGQLPSRPLYDQPAWSGNR
ncbi:MAG: hypothetical protein R3E47_04530 [Paracoccaceae bacterium]